MIPADCNTREDVMRLLPLVVAEATKIVEAFADLQKLHQTDVAAMSNLMAADAKGEPLTTGALGRALGLTSGATTFVVNRLEKAGLVNRVRDKSDQRKIFLHFSEDGRALAKKFYLPVHQLSISVTDRFTIDEQNVIRRFLTDTAEAMASHREALLEGAAQER